MPRAALHRCVNVRSGHSTKGHQTQDGHIFAYGPYQARFTFDTYREELLTAVYTRLLYLLDRLSLSEVTGESRQVGSSILFPSIAPISKLSVQLDFDIDKIPGDLKKLNRQKFIDIDYVSRVTKTSGIAEGFKF